MDPHDADERGGRKLDGRGKSEVRFVTLPFFERRMEEVKERASECEAALLGSVKAIEEVIVKRKRRHSALVNE
jgi:hypothetical protein